jgi:UDP-N-acetylglucosamine 2-epimerase (non-hydrolysing)
MSKLKIMHVVGARPNYMKVAPLAAALAPWQDTVKQILVHTGQHYDYQMSRIFFEELEMPDPDEYLGVGSGHASRPPGRRPSSCALETAPDWVGCNVNPQDSLFSCQAGVRLAHVRPACARIVHA